MISNTLDLYPLHVSSNPLPYLKKKKKMSPDIYSGSLEDKIVPSWESLDYTLLIISTSKQTAKFQNQKEHWKVKMFILQHLKRTSTSPVLVFCFDIYSQ